MTLVTLPVSPFTIRRRLLFLPKMNRSPIARPRVALERFEQLRAQAKRGRRSRVRHLRNALGYADRTDGRSRSIDKHHGVREVYVHGKALDCFLGTVAVVVDLASTRQMPRMTHAKLIMRAAVAVGLTLSDYMVQAAREKALNDCRSSP